jgi:protein-S-isoprenylcysteine O-methyltransferase Ste14
VTARVERHGDNGWLAAGYAGLVGFFVLERRLRAGGESSALTASEGDRGTTRLLIAAYAAATDVPLVARRLGFGRLPAWVAPVGLVVQGAGLSLRAWSMRELGRSYTRTLLVARDEQAVVSSGPYRIVRHPGYLGSLLTWTGFALTTCSLPAVGLVVGPLAAVYARRIAAEEELLRRELPGYESYAEATARLIPVVW